MKSLFILLLAAGLASPAAQAGLWDKVNAAKACALELTAKGVNAATEAASDVAAKGSDFSRLTGMAQAQLQELSIGMNAVYGQLCEIGYTGKECSTASIGTLLSEAFPMAKRVVMFGGDLEDVKDGIVLPFLARIRDIREAREIGLAPADLARRLTKLSLFTVEVALKLPRVVPSALESSVSGALRGLVNGVATTNPGGGLDVLPNKSLSEALFTSIVANIKQSLVEPGLTLNQRLDRMISMEDIMINWFKCVGTGLGWSDIETELAQWRQIPESERK